MQAVIRLCYYAMIDKTLFNVVLNEMKGVLSKHY